MRRIKATSAAAAVAIVIVGAVLVSIPVAMAQQGYGQRQNSGSGGSLGSILNVKTSPPVVVSSFPQAGTTDVDPDTTEIKVTFSKDMQNGNWSFSQLSNETYPITTGPPHYLEDGRTCVLPVKLSPGKPYVILVNVPPYTNFMDTDGRRAVQWVLVFETKK